MSINMGKYLFRALWLSLMHICSIVFLCVIITRHVIVVKQKERANTSVGYIVSWKKNTYCLVFLVCLSSSCFPNVVSFTGLSIPVCPFGFANVYSWRIEYSVATPGYEKINGVSTRISFQFPQVHFEYII